MGDKSGWNGVRPQLCACGNAICERENEVVLVVSEEGIASTIIDQQLPLELVETHATMSRNAALGRESRTLVTSRIRVLVSSAAV